MRNYIVLAIPAFFLLIALEWLWARWQERDYYRLDDAVNDLSCGILQQLFEVFAKTALSPAISSSTSAGGCSTCRARPGPGRPVS